MTQEQRTKALNWIIDKRGANPCSSCGVSPTSSTLPLFHIGNLSFINVMPDDFVNESNIIPILPIFCNNCGHIEFYSAKELGIV